MAKYDVTYKCGHTGIVNIGGPVRDRERKADWYSTQLCPECYKKKQRQVRADKRKAIDMQSLGLPELKGTSKQVSWAEDIRAEKLYELLNLRGIDKGKAVELFSKETNAKWWIDARFDPISSIANAIARRYK